jgi:aminopeptidase N
LGLLLSDDEDLAGRAAAAESLGKKGGPEAVKALEAAVMGDKFWGVQAAAAKALGAIRTTAARDALLRSLVVKNLKARRAVVAALGEFHGDETVLAAITPFAKKDQSWFVESEANRTAGKLRLPGSLDVIKTNIDRPSFRQVVRVGCIDGLVELRDEAGFELLAECARYGAFAQSRAAAVGAIGRLGAFFPERKRRLGEQIAEFLRDPDFRVRIAAANALKTIKDESQAGALDEMASRELDGRAIRIGRENAAILRKGANTDAEVKALREEFEKLRDENGKLRERLERIEAQRSQPNG